MLNIKLADDDVKFLMDFVKKGQKSARSLTRARILLLANQEKGEHRSRKRYVLAGILL